MQFKEISKNDYLKVGKYRLTFTANIFIDQIAWLIDNLSGILEKSYEFVEGKPIRIYKVETDNKDKIFIYFELLNNPVPVALIVAGIIGLLGMVGTLLILDKVEEISDSPLGVGAGLTLSVGSIALLVGGGYLLFKYGLSKVS
jgi:hypothetical protein